MKFNSIGDITEKILELERKYDLLEWRIKEIKIYEIVRYILYINAISANLNVTEKKSFLKSNLFSKIKNKSSRVKNFLYYNPYLDKSKSETLLFESGRKQKINGKYIDPFTALIKEELLKKKSGFTIYQSSYFFDRLAEKGKNTRHLDFILLSSAVKAKLFKLNFLDEERKSITKFGDEIKNQLNLNLDFQNLIKKQLANFIKLSEYFSRLLEIKKPEQIYIVNFCDKPALINEAKKRKIEVIDIQHGFISSKDIIYHYPDTIENHLSYFPDRFLAWSEDWMGGCKLPLSRDRIKFTDNYILKTEACKYVNIPKNPKKALILSQDTLTHQILESTYELVKANPDFIFYFKPHPNEYAYIESYKRYSELIKFENFHTLNVKENLYEHFSNTTYIIGVYTTSIIESLYFKCNILILSLPGKEMMNDIIEKGKAKLLTDLHLNSYIIK